MINSTPEPVRYSEYLKFRDAVADNHGRLENETRTSFDRTWAALKELSERFTAFNKAIEGVWVVLGEHNARLTILERPEPAWGRVLDTILRRVFPSTLELSRLRTRIEELEALYEEDDIP